MSASASESFVLEGDPSPSHETEEDVDSLPSTDTEETQDAHEESDAEREWRESMQQMELLLTIFVIPYIGKYFGRKVAYWG
jgi:hypothetical protein